MEKCAVQLELPINEPVASSEVQLTEVQLKDLWVWCAAGNYFRLRNPDASNVNQYHLYNNIVQLGEEFGYTKDQVVTEIGFPTWGVSLKGKPYRYDIAIPDYKLLIEYNGPQHYCSANYSVASAHYYNDDQCGTAADKLANRMYNDNRKIKLAEMNGYSWLVFTYMENVTKLEWVRLRLASVW